MKGNPDITPKGIIVNALRMLWLRSRERVSALKRDSYTCRDCGKKKSTAKGREFKVTVDHLDKNIPWDLLVEVIREHLLVNHARLETVCPEDHKKRTELRRQIERAGL